MKMSKVFKASEPSPRSLATYERVSLEELLATASMDEEPEDAIDLEALRERVLMEAREEAESKVREAYAEGFRRGEEAGRAKFLAEVADAAELLRVAGAAVREAREEFLSSLEPQVIALTGAIAKNVLHRECATDSELLRRTVRRALERIVDRDKVIIHVNPNDADVLRAEKVDLLEQFDGVRQITILPDPEIVSGGCIVETERIHVDARVDAQLERILNVLLEEPEKPFREDSIEDA
jgi:flagellar biosynthesis/type III secretory pathway protein FliH